LLAHTPGPLETPSLCADDASFDIRLALERFRSHKNFVLQTTAPLTLIVGPNGSGKTNILEALSLFSPGRGLRSAAASEWYHQPIGTLQHKHAPHNTPENTLETNSFFDQISHPPSDRFTPWRLCLSFETLCEKTTLKCHPHAVKKGARCFQRNNVLLKRQLDIQDDLLVSWMTPVMDLLFRESMGQRRRFFDRLVMGHDKSYAPLLLTFEKALTEWKKLCEIKKDTPLWHESLEHILAERATLLTQKRATFLHIFQKKQQTLGTPFTKLTLTLKGLSEKAFDTNPHTLYETFKQFYAEARLTFQKFKPLTFGPNATEVAVSFKGMSIERCSTGEQKLSLLLLILTHIHLQKHHKLCFLLLDELSAHLDNRNLHMWMDLVLPLKRLHTFVTGTDISPFKTYHATHIKLT